MKLATWNVNSLRVRLSQVLDWLARYRPDVVCLQETKTEDRNFPVAEFEAAGYHVACSGQKTYNGVAIASRRPLKELARALPDFPDEQKRLIAATVDGVRLINVYVPNGAAVGSEKYDYKLAWLQSLRRYAGAQMKRYPKLALLGDFNIAPEDRDVHDPEAWEGSVLVSGPEREAFRALLELGLVDVFRRFDQPPESFSWWDYRAAAFRRNHGLRIDHILCSRTLAKTCTRCTIDREPRAQERPSDHAPVVAVFR